MVTNILTTFICNTRKSKMKKYGCLIFIYILFGLSHKSIAEDHSDCDGFLCEYGEDINESPKLRKILNDIITKKIGFDLNKVSRMEISATAVDNYDVPESQSRRADAVRVRFELNSPGKIMGNEIPGDASVLMCVMGDDVQLDSLQSGQGFSWKPFPGNASGSYCLWTPDKIILSKGDKYQGIEVTEGKVRLSTYRKWPGKIKKVGQYSNDGKFKYRGKVYEKTWSVFFKQNGDIFTEEELAKLKHDAKEEKKRVEWMAKNDEGGINLCAYGRLQVPDDFYMVE